MREGRQGRASLTFTLMYATGIDYMESAVRELASNASLAGIKVILEPETLQRRHQERVHPADQQLAAR